MLDSKWFYCSNVSQKIKHFWQCFSFIGSEFSLFLSLSLLILFGFMSLSILFAFIFEKGTYELKELKDSTLFTSGNSLLNYITFMSLFYFLESTLSVLFCYFPEVLSGLWIWSWIELRYPTSLGHLAREYRPTENYSLTTPTKAEKSAISFMI